MPASALDVLDRSLTSAAEVGLLHRTAEDEWLDGRTIQLSGKHLLHFGSCSYLGLELDPRVKGAAIDAAGRYGPLFSSSRAYLSSPLYPRLEERLTGIFGEHIVLTPTTTLGHLAALPVLCESGDALLLDRQGHNSLHLASQVVANRGAHVELVPHHRLDLLEARIAELARTHRRVWYAGDGVYSMYGDVAPLAELRALLDRHEQMHVYLDDAHGVSWTGPNGCGYVLGGGALHERMCVATTLGKCFGAGGSLIVCPNAEWARLIFTCGGPMIFAGPIAPPVLGAAIASAEIHLTPELAAMQAELRERIAYCNALLLARELPLVSSTSAPVRFVGAGSVEAAHRTGRALINDGFFTNIAIFPAVAQDCAGIRFTLTRNHRREDIEQLVDALDRNLRAALADVGLELADVRARFEASLRGDRRSARSAATPTVEHRTSIADVPAASWDRCFADRGSFGSAGLAVLERAFSGHAAEQDNWRFHYYWVAGEDGKPLAATFFTSALWKHDIFAPAPVSSALEAARAREPGHLVSRVLAMGSLLTEGNHLWLDRGRAWGEPLRRLLEAATAQAAAEGAAGVVLRDIPQEDAELRAFLADQGYAELPMPEALVAEIDWQDEAALVRGLSANARRHYRRRVAPWNAAYTVEVLEAGGRPVAPAELAHFFALYDGVRSRNLALNTHPLPRDIYARLLESPCHELLVLRPVEGAREPVAVVASYRGANHYVPIFIGMDYRFVHSTALYRQSLRHMLLRARALGCRRVELGIGATFEKRCFGAHLQPASLFADAGFLRMLQSVESEA